LRATAANGHFEAGEVLAQMDKLLKTRRRGGELYTPVEFHADLPVVAKSTETAEKLVALGEHEALDRLQKVQKIVVQALEQLDRSKA